MQLEIDRIISQIKNSTDPFNKAKLLDFLQSQKQIRISDLGKLLVMKPSYICHFLRLNRLSEMIVDGYYSKLISLSHLFIISRIKDPKKLMAVYEKILSNNLTVSQTEELVRDVIHGIKSKGQYLDENYKADIITKLSAMYKDIKVKLIQSRIKSKLILEIRGSLDESNKTLTKIIEKITI